MQLTIAPDQTTATAPDGTVLVFRHYGTGGAPSYPCRDCYCRSSCGNALRNLCTYRLRADKHGGIWIKQPCDCYGSPL